MGIEHMVSDDDDNSSILEFMIWSKFSDFIANMYLDKNVGRWFSETLCKLNCI